MFYRLGVRSLRCWEAGRHLVRMKLNIWAAGYSIQSERRTKKNKSGGTAHTPQPRQQQSGHYLPMEHHFTATDTRKRK